MGFFESRGWTSGVSLKTSTATTKCSRLRKVFQKTKKAILIPQHKKNCIPAPSPQQVNEVVEFEPHIRHSPDRNVNIARAVFVRGSNAAALLRSIKERSEKHDTQAKSASSVVAEGNDLRPSLREAEPPAAAGAKTLCCFSNGRLGHRTKEPPKRLNIALLSCEARLGLTRQKNLEDTAATLYTSPLRSPTWSSQSSEGSQETLVHSSPKSSRSSSSKQAESKALSDAHHRLSKDAWQSYQDDLQKAEIEAGEADWRSYLEMLQQWHDSRTAGLQAQIKSVEEAHKVDLASHQCKHNAEVQAMRLETDQTLQEVQERGEELRFVLQRMAEIEEEVEVVRQERDTCKSEMVLWQTRASEAMAIGSDLKTSLDAIQIERDLLKRGNNAAASTSQLQTDMTHLRTANEKLTSDVRALRGAQEYARQLHVREEQEIKTLQNQVKAAAIEVGFLSRINIGYRTMTEDRPELSAHLDGLLKRKDEAYKELVERLNTCDSMVAEEKLRREIDREHADGVRRNLRREMSYYKEKLGGLETSRNNFQMQNQQLSLTLAGNFAQDDAVRALIKDREVYREDRDSFIHMVHSREAHVEETMAQIAPLKVKIVELEYALEATTPRIDELQADVNGLELRNENLLLEVETQNSELEFKNRELQADLSTQTRQLEDLYRDSLSTPIAQQLSNMQVNEIAGLKEQLQRIVSEKDYWYNRAVEQREDFCHVFNAELVVDVNSEETRYRLRHAERTAAELTQLMRERGIWQNMPGGMDPRHADVDEAERQVRRYAEESAA